MALGKFQKAAIEGLKKQKSATAKAAEAARERAATAGKGIKEGTELGIEEMFRQAGRARAGAGARLGGGAALAQQRAMTAETTAKAGQARQAAAQAIEAQKAGAAREAEAAELKAAGAETELAAEEFSLRKDAAESAQLTDTKIRDEMREYIGWVTTADDLKELRDRYESQKALAATPEEEAIYDKYIKILKDAEAGDETQLDAIIGD